MGVITKILTLGTCVTNFLVAPLCLFGIPQSFIMSSPCWIQYAWPWSTQMEVQSLLPVLTDFLTCGKTKSGHRKWRLMLLQLANEFVNLSYWFRRRNIAHSINTDWNYISVLVHEYCHYGESALNHIPGVPHFDLYFIHVCGKWC